MNILLMSVVLLWLLVLGLIAVVFALARQIGVLHERVAPAGALITGGGPDVGSPAPKVLGRRLDGSTLLVGDRLAVGAAQLLIFISADCPVCKKIVPLAKSVAKSERLQLVFVSDGEESELKSLVRQQGLQDYPFINGPEVGMAFQITRLPYGILLSDAGEIAAKGLVNTREHLESLVVAKATGFRSAQSYLEEQAARSESGTS